MEILSLSNKKKRFTLLLALLITLSSIAFVQAITMSHPAAEVQSGTFIGGANEVWVFPGRVGIGGNPGDGRLTVDGLIEGYKGVEGLSDINVANTGVSGTTSTGKGVRGWSTGTGIGGFFHSQSGYGLIVDKGNVGIGTTSPGALLDIGGGKGRLYPSGSDFWIENTIANIFIQADTDLTLSSSAGTGAEIKLKDDGDITMSGNVGIGFVGEPAAILDVQGSATLSAIRALGSATTGGLIASGVTGVSAFGSTALRATSTGGGDNLAGDFNGNVDVSGTLTVQGKISAENDICVKKPGGFPSDKCASEKFYDTWTFTNNDPGGSEFRIFYEGVFGGFCADEDGCEIRMYIEECKANEFPSVRNFFMWYDDSQDKWEVRYGHSLVSRGTNNNNVADLTINIDNRCILYDGLRTYANVYTDNNYDFYMWFTGGCDSPNAKCVLHIRD